MGGTGKKEKDDENSGHYVISSSRPPERRPVERRTLVQKVAKQGQVGPRGAKQGQEIKMLDFSIKQMVNESTSLIIILFLLLVLSP